MAAWVFGAAPQGAAVAVNDEPVAVEPDGSFAHPVGLAAGENLVEVTVSKDGGVARKQIPVFSAAPASGPPLDVIFPPDGYSTSQPTVWVIGATSTGGSVAVNGVPVPVDVMGLFKVEIAINGMVDFVEVTAVGADGTVQTVVAAVFFDESFQ
jgi:hypothetical protein